MRTWGYRGNDLFPNKNKTQSKLHNCLSCISLHIPLTLASYLEVVVWYVVVYISIYISLRGHGPQEKVKGWVLIDDRTSGSYWTKLFVGAMLCLVINIRLHWGRREN